MEFHSISLLLLLPSIFITWRGKTNIYKDKFFYRFFANICHWNLLQVFGKYWIISKMDSPQGDPEYKVEDVWLISLLFQMDEFDKLLGKC